MPNKKITKIKTIEEIKESLANSITGYDSGYILRKAEINYGDGKSIKEFTPDTAYYKAMTLFEFDKGVILLNSVPELHRIFAIDFSKGLQSEYDCKTPSEKSLAEVIALNFVRILSIQQKINGYLGMNTINQNGIGYLNVMSKELDRAERHYIASLEALRMIKMPQLQVNIRTQTAIVGQNQVIQSKNEIN